MFPGVLYVSQFNILITPWFSKKEPSGATRGRSENGSEDDGKCYNKVTNKNKSDRLLLCVLLKKYHL